jgi:hypothetical protein
MTPMDRIHPTDGTDINVTAHWLPEIGVTPRLPVSVTTRLNKNNADASWTNIHTLSLDGSNGRNPVMFKSAVVSAPEAGDSARLRPA